VEIEVDFVEGVVSSLQITGDFFIHPEEGVNLLEDAVVGGGVDEAQQRLDQTIQEHSLELLGITSAHLVTLLRRAACGE